MKHLLIALVLLLSQMMACASHRDEEEEKQSESQSQMQKSPAIAHPIMYDDEVPNIKFIKTINLSKEFEWWDKKNGKKENIERRMADISKKINNLFNALGYQCLRGINTFDNNKVDFIFGKKDKDFFKKIFFLEVQYSFDEENPSFEKKTGYFPHQAYGDNKWKIPFTKPGNKMKKETLNEMSWKWIDLNLHKAYQQINSSSFDKSSKDYVTCEKIYKMIKSKGLEKIFPRVAVSVNHKKYFSFYALFNNEKDEKRSTRAIQRIAK